MKILRFIILIIVSFLFVSATAQTRRALVIGIGEQEDKSWAKINGDKDVPYVQKMLRGAEYKDISTLVNKQATKAGIVTQFKNLTARCKAGDIVYIHFSGHGQQVTDVNGDESDDKMDESWIPYDAYLKYGRRDRGEKHLIDDEINVLLTAIKHKIGDSGKMLVVVDACHSGNSTWGITSFSFKDDIGKTPVLLLNTDADETIRGVYDEFVIPITKKTRTKKAPEQWLTLSACEDFQLNQEMKTPQVGKLTYTLYTLSKEGNISFQKIEKMMERYRSRLPQNPIQTGRTNYKISDFLR